MRALQLTAWRRDPEMREVPDPEPGPGQVVVRIGGAGACHSDLHLMHDFDTSCRSAISTRWSQRASASPAPVNHSAKEEPS